MTDEGRCRGLGVSGSDVAVEGGDTSTAVTCVFLVAYDGLCLLCMCTSILLVDVVCRRWPGVPRAVRQSRQVLDHSAVALEFGASRGHRRSSFVLW